MLCCRYCTDDVKCDYCDQVFKRTAWQEIKSMPERAWAQWVISHPAVIVLCPDCGIKQCKEMRDKFNEPAKV